MKVTVTLELDVRPADWAAEYGVSLGEVPADVTRYVHNAVRWSPGAEAACNDVTLKG